MLSLLGVSYMPFLPVLAIEPAPRRLQRAGPDVQRRRRGRSHRRSAAQRPRPRPGAPLVPGRWRCALRAEPGDGGAFLLVGLDVASAGGGEPRLRGHQHHAHHRDPDRRRPAVRGRLLGLYATQAVGLQPLGTLLYSVLGSAHLFDGVTVGAVLVGASAIAVGLARDLHRAEETAPAPATCGRSRGVRSFLAVAVRPPAQQPVADLIDALRGRVAGVRWVDTATTHITLHFFADLPADRLGPVADAVRSAVEPVPAFPLRLGGLGSFPSAPRARVLWLGLAEEAPPLGSLAAAVQGAVAGCGFELDERPFPPSHHPGPAGASVRPGGLAWGARRGPPFPRVPRRARHPLESHGGHHVREVFPLRAVGGPESCERRPSPLGLALRRARVR